MRPFVEEAMGGGEGVRFIEGDEAPSSLAMTSHEAASKSGSETKSVSEKAGKQHEATATSVCKTLAAKSDKMMGG